MQSFIGMCNYYRNCIPNFGLIAEPLLKLTRKNDTGFNWSPECTQAFELLKEALTSDSVMAYPNPTKPYLLYCDASEYSIGSVLCQLDSNNVERVVQYLSHQLTDTQRRWSTIEKEAFGIVYSVNKLRCYLYGAKFTVFTDHKPLVSFFNKPFENTKLQRWSLLIAEYGTDIQYREGKHNVRADLLSRIRSEVNTPLSLLAVSYTKKDLQEIDDSVDFLRRDRINVGAVRAAQKVQFSQEWAEAELDDVGDYVFYGRILYSMQLPFPGAMPRPRLLLPSEWHTDVITNGHLAVGHMSVGKT